MSGPHPGGFRSSATRPPLITPSALARYRDCPQRYHLSRHALHPADEEFSPALARGRAVHGVLAVCAAARQDGRPLPGNLADQIARALPHDGYPDTRAWEEDVAIATTQADAGLAYLRQAGTILAVERFHRWTYRGDADCPPFVLGAVADLVTAGVDDEGRAFATITDYKTARRKTLDLIQEVALRIVVRAALGERYAYLVSTTVHLVDGTWSSIVRDDATCRAIWRTAIKGTAAALQRDATWAPVADIHCGWCPFAGNGCALDQPGNGGEGTARWLEGGGAAATGEAR